MIDKYCVSKFTYGSCGKFNVTLPFISAPNVRYPKKPIDIYNKATNPILKSSTQKKSWGLRILFSTGSTCKKSRFSGKEEINISFSFNPERSGVSNFIQQSFRKLVSRTMVNQLKRKMENF